MALDFTSSCSRTKKKRRRRRRRRKGDLYHVSLSG